MNSSVDTNGTNGVSHSPQPLKVTIVGAGIGGLFAAIALRRAGHNCTIYESSRFAIETGAAIHLPSNVNGLLRRYGMIPEDHGAVQCEWVSERLATGEVVFTVDTTPVHKAFAYPWQLIHRIDLHATLKEMATSEEGEGKKVELVLQSRVVDVNVEESSITLQDGKVVKGDLVIGADGVHSVVRDHVTGLSSTAQPSGSSAFRFLIPTDIIASDPKTSHFVEKTGALQMINGKGKRIVMYPCRKNTALNFVIIHFDEEHGVSAKGWNQSASKETLLKVCDEYGDDVKALLGKVDPESIKIWKLLDLEALPYGSWFRNRTILLGDAAHPFLPHQGQGGAQAIEDAAALGAVMPLGTTIEDIPSRLKIWNECRYQRATTIQEYSRDSGFGANTKRKMDPMQFTGFNFDHDAYDHAKSALKWYQIDQAKYTRMPLGFGPTSSPRQDLAGNPRSMNTDAKYTTAYMTFRTKKTYLQTLMPSRDLNIKSRGGWATATFLVNKLENLAWLGGRGYSYFGLFIHDVVRGNPNAPGSETEEKGDVLPVLFENMADPIITGREEIGFSKVFATLDEKRGDSTYHLTAGWEGTAFCEMKLDDLVPEDDATKTAEPPLYCQEVGGERKYILAPALDMPSSKERIWKAGKAEISFSKLTGQEFEKAFPTLGNIVEGLRGIEIVEVLSSGMKASM